MTDPIATALARLFADQTERRDPSHWNIGQKINLAKLSKADPGQLRAREQDHFPIVALTANALRGEANRALAAGMDDYLTKPLQLPALREALERWLPQASAVDGDRDVAIERVEAEPQRRALDINVLKRLIGDEPASLHSLLEDFLRAAVAGITALRAALVANDFGEVGSIAHQLKSSARSVGALSMGDRCAELENSSRLGDRSITAEAVAAFEAATDELLPELQEQLRQLDASLRLEANSNF